MKSNSSICGSIEQLGLLLKKSAYKNLDEELIMNKVSSFLVWHSICKLTTKQLPMKKFIGIGLISLLSIAFFGCGTSKIKAQREHPFKVLEANYVNWVSQQPDITGITVNIIIDNPEIQLDSIYFRNNSAALKHVKSFENLVFTGSFKTSITPHDYILHSNPKQEFGNKPPVVVSKTPFKLTDNEAVVSYFYKNKINYYKISAMKEIGIKGNRQ